jgi:hypothetical protein
MKRLFQALLLGASIITASAQSEAITDFASGSAGPFTTTAGWAFVPSETVFVNSLGCLATLISVYGQVDVGIWDNNGTKLASVSVLNTNTMVNASRYVPIDPVTLTAAQTYRVGIYSGSSMYLTFLDSPPASGEFVTTGPQITSIRNATATTGNGFPANLGPAGTAVFGGNFIYSQVPEPSSAALLLGGVLLLASRRRA